MSTRNILDFGALPDGVHNSTVAIQQALDAGPGTVLVPQGIFLTGTLRLRSGNELLLAEDGGLHLYAPRAPCYSREERYDRLAVAGSRRENGVCVNGPCSSWSA